MATLVEGIRIDTFVQVNITATTLRRRYVD